MSPITRTVLLILPTSIKRNEIKEAGLKRDLKLEAGSDRRRTTREWKTSGPALVLALQRL